MIENFQESSEKLKKLICDNQTKIESVIKDCEQIFKKNTNKKSFKIKCLTELKNLIDITKSSFKEVLYVKVN